MSKPIVCGLAALFITTAVQAQEFYKPQAEVEVFGSRVTTKSTSNDEDIEGALKLKGLGGGARATGYLFPNAQGWVEATLSKPSLNDIFEDGADDKIKLSLMQIRAGVRAYSVSKSEHPVYTSIGAEYLHRRAKISLDFGPTTTEDDVGEDPAADADNVADTISVRDSTDYALGRLRLGYRSRQAHFYSDFGYGTSSHDGTVFDILTGLSYQIVSDYSLFGEYRRSSYKDEGDKDVINDFRIGVGTQF